MRVVLLDAGPLGMVTNPRATPTTIAANEWLEQLLEAGAVIVVPEIADYEVRRELLRIGSAGVARLDALAQRLAYEPLTTNALRLAAEFWARARQTGVPTAADAALDCDVILAAQASLLTDEGDETVIATTNAAHLARFFPARLWSEIAVAE